ncbi:hypothetical protein MUK42_33178 [Musa troglodytarum]|uniref:Uncharacterized protein n=1 Tax=Musa troglodytarum TaxID=320322 RepID=A0A9E7JQM9_9LILI|nr:hypothetical protein MUK42_33178 [Musa troglodytarum]
MDGEDIRTRRPYALLCLIFNLTIGSCRERDSEVEDNGFKSSREKELIEGLKKLYDREGKWQSSRALGVEKSSKPKRKSEKGESHGRTLVN